METEERASIAPAIDPVTSRLVRALAGFAPTGLADLRRRPEEVEGPLTRAGRPSPQR